MNEAKVMQLFQVFSLTNEPRKYRDLTDAAMRQVNDALRPGADADDLRLCSYAAALANLQYRRIIAAGSVSPSFAGSAAADRCADGQCSLAEHLVLAYRAAAAPLLRDDAFVFLRTGGDHL